MMLRTSNPILHRLEKSIETNASREEIADALRAAEELGDDLPPLLAFRARERIDADRFLGRRRIMFSVACAVFLFLCPFSAIGLTTVTQLRAANRDNAAFQQLIDNQQWDEAQAFLDSLDTATRSRPEFVRGQEVVQQEIDRRDQRKAEFEQLVAQIRADPDEKIDDATVRRLDELAESDEERAIAVEMAAKADEQSLLREAGRVDDQTRQFEQLQQAVDQFLDTESESLAAAARTSRTLELQRQLQQFVSANHLSNPELTEAAKQTAALLAREDRNAQSHSERQDRIKQITNSVGDVDLFVRSAGQFAEAFPGDPMSPSLEPLGDSHELIDRALAWFGVLGHPAFLSPETADARQSGQWLEAFDRAASLEPNHPLAARAAPWRSHYAAVAKRQQAIKQLRELFQSDLFRPMYVYPDGAGRKYYSSMSPERDSPTAHVVEYFADLSLSRKTKNFGARYRQQILPHVRLAGHCDYAAKAKRVAASMDQSEFTPSVYRLISELRGLDSQTEIDPIFQLDLMRRLLRIGTEGSEPMREGFGDWLARLESSDFAWETNWVAPDESDSMVAEARGKAISLLNSTGNWDEAVKRMGESFRRYREPRPLPPRWIGWVTREQDRYVAMLGPESQSSGWKGQWFVLARDKVTGQTSMVELAGIEFVPGQHEFLIEDDAGKVTGAIVCLFPDGTVTQSTDAS